jgi:hypothetical protein
MQLIVCCSQDQFVCCPANTRITYCGVHFTSPFFQVQCVYHLATAWYLYQFCDLFTCHLASASPDNCVHFMSLCPVFRTNLLASWPFPHPKYHALHIRHYTTFSGPDFVLPVGHCLAPKHSALYVTYSTLFSGPVCWPFGHYLPTKHCALNITYSTLFSGPICLPAGHCLTSEHCVLYIT